jgi:hypothetical protein
MSERFGIPDHAPQHAPDHALQNPTPADPVTNMGGWDVPTYGSTSYGSPSYAGGAAYTGPYVRPKRSVILAVVLATVLGPLGLFYVNILSGIVALMIIPVTVRAIAFAIAFASGGGMNTVYNVAVPVLWCITIPWSIIGVKIRNSRIDRAAAQKLQA